MTLTYKIKTCNDKRNTQKTIWRLPKKGTERHLLIPPQNFHNSAIPTEAALSHKLICSQYAGENKDYLVVGLVSVQF